MDTKEQAFYCQVCGKLEIRAVCLHEDNRERHERGTELCDAWYNPCPSCHCEMVILQEDWGYLGGRKTIEDLQKQWYIIFDLENSEPLRSFDDGKTAYFGSLKDARAWLWETWRRDNFKLHKLKDIYARFRFCAIDYFEGLTKPKLTDEERTVMQVETLDWDKGGLEALLRRDNRLPEPYIDGVLAKEGIEKIGNAVTGMPTSEDYHSEFDIDFQPKEFDGKPLNLATFGKLLKEHSDANAH